MQIEEVDVATPRGKVLARRLTVAVPFDEGLLVTGPNGSGALPPLVLAVRTDDIDPVFPTLRQLYTAMCAVSIAGTPNRCCHCYAPTEGIVLPSQRQHQ